jgi:hypothetical protein
MTRHQVIIRRDLVCLPKSVGEMPGSWDQVLILTVQVGVEGAMLSVEAARVYIHS